MRHFAYHTGKNERLKISSDGGRWGGGEASTPVTFGGDTDWKGSLGVQFSKLFKM